jgi:hypothetical protein
MVSIFQKLSLSILPNSVNRKEKAPKVKVNGLKEEINVIANVETYI